MGPRHTLTLFLAMACQPSPVNQTGFGSTPDITTGGAASTGEGSTSSSSSTSSMSSGTTTGDSGSVGGGADTFAEPLRDLGVTPDFGEDTPVGCKGKIDFLFVISREWNMQYRQAQLTAAFPEFIETIKAKFEDFDYHIMVVTGDDGWGNDICTDTCSTPGCKVGDPCCEWSHPDWIGKSCCGVPEYPCQDLDLVTKCDRTWGAGEVFPAGEVITANKPCPIDGGLRYLVTGQTNLDETFECVATIGSSGYGLLGQALVAALEKPINDPGGCNKGFLRSDALLMATFIYTNPDQDSEGWPNEWAEAVIDAKHGDEKSVVMFNIGRTECDGDRVCDMVKMFTYHHVYYALAPDYGSGFAEAASLVETACAGFVPPPG